jgi:hypothetical protein
VEVTPGLAVAEIGLGLARSKEGFSMGDRVVMAAILGWAPAYARELGLQLVHLTRAKSIREGDIRDYLALPADFLLLGTKELACFWVPRCIGDAVGAQYSGAIALYLREHGRTDVCQLFYLARTFQRGAGGTGIG